LIEIFEGVSTLREAIALPAVANSTSGISTASPLAIRLA
jgi:hypothetical protein